MTTITTTIDPPLPTDAPAVFNTKAFTAWGALNTWAGQANTVAGEVNTNAGTATTKASEASLSAAAALESANLAEAAAGASGAIAWISGTTYTAGAVVYSPINFQNYRRKTTGAGTTDPSLDTTNWAVLGADPNSTLPFSNSVLLAQSQAIALYF